MRWLMSQRPSCRVSHACFPGRHVHRVLARASRPFYGALSDAVWARARVQLNQGKTRVWNAAGEEPPNLPAIQPQ